MKKIYSCMLAMSVAMAANAVDYYVIGGFNDWTLKDSKCLFTDKGDGTYELDYEGTLTSGFKINDGTWSNDAANFGGAGNDLVLGTPYALVSGVSGKDISMAENVNNPHIVLNPEAKTLIVSGQSVEAEYVYVLHGNWDGGKAWESINLTENNGKWELKGKEVSDCNFGIKKNDKASGSQVEWYASAGEADVVVGTAMPITVNGANFVLVAGTYDFTLDMNAMTLTVSEAGDEPGPGPDPQPSMVYGIKGDIFGDPAWSVENMTLTDGNWVLADVEVLKGNFGIVKLENGEQAEWIAATGASDVVLGEAMSCGTIGVNNFAIKAGTYTFTFNPEAMTLTVTGEEGEEVEDILSYAIHGDIFGNPKWSTEMMTEKDGEWELMYNECAAGSFGIKQVNQFGQQKIWYASAGDGVIGLATPTEAVVNGTNWTLTEAGAYIFTFNPETLKLTVKVNPNVGVETIGVAEGEAEYFNLQGARVENPAAGIYVKVLNGKATKVVVK